MNVQLIYATGVKDLSAIGALENIIRLRNTRADRRTGRRLVELDDNRDGPGQIEAARVAFDSPASSLARSEGRKSQQDVPIAESADHAPAD
jgi:hypothetical protein